MQTKGSCLCKRVQLKVTGEPFTFNVCHCSNCKKFSGSAFMGNAFFSDKNVDFVQGLESIQVYEDTATGSGKTLSRVFCKHCGSSLYLKPPGSDLTIIASGIMEDSARDWQPRKESFVHERMPWVKELVVTPKKAKL